MQRKQAIAFCDRWLPTWTGNRPDDLIEFYDDDVYFRDPVHPGGLHGRAALLAYLQRLLKRNPTWTWVRQEVFPTTDGFTLKWRATFPFPTGIVEIDGLDIVVIQAGRIVRNEVYFDTAPLANPLAKFGKARQKK
ncbi:MAG: nuclear transport factor 2 family protein [Oligoflexia bacterium]|nr:nuclear transport factor 2 family protein [Oligoflexia bacterium]